MASPGVGTTQNLLASCYAFGFHLATVRAKVSEGVASDRGRVRQMKRKRLRANGKRELLPLLLLDMARRWRQEWLSFVLGPNVRSQERIGVEGLLSQ